MREALLAARRPSRLSLSKYPGLQGQGLGLSPRGRNHMFALLPPPHRSIHFSMVLLLFKGIAVFQTFKGARNQWFWLLNRKLKALSVPLS